MSLALTISLFSCKGEEGEIGPKGDTGAIGPQGPMGPSINQVFENGFIKGTVKGKRTDGTAFKEAFEYKLASPETFEKVFATVHKLYLERSQNLNEGDMNSVDLGLLVTNRDQNPSVKFENYSIWFTKLLANRDLFHVMGGANFNSTSATLPVSRTNNTTYKLVNYGNTYTSGYDSSTGDYYITYTDQDGNKICFVEDYNSELGYHHKFAYTLSSSGVKSVNSVTYGDLIVDYNSTSGKYLFYTKTGTNLSETFTIAADNQEITNFTYNASTGLVTFNYKVTIDALRSMDNSNSYSFRNSTNHQLEITGSVSATVYNGTVMRLRAE